MANTLDALAMAVLEHLAAAGVPAKYVQLVLARACRLHLLQEAGIEDSGPPPKSPAEFRAAIPGEITLESEPAEPEEQAPVAPKRRKKTNGGPAPSSTRIHRNKPQYPDLRDRLAAVMIANPTLSLTDVFIRLEKHYGKDFMTLPYFRTSYWLPYQAGKGNGG
jgi:hypothetical protein